MYATPATMAFIFTSRQMQYNEYLASKVAMHKKNAQGKVEDWEIERYCEAYYAPVFPTSTLLQPFGATINLLKKLKYEPTPADILWANYVHLMLSVMVQNPSVRALPFGSIICVAIEAMLEDYKIEHTDPYELWIDAWIITKELEPVDKTPYGQHTGQIIA